MVKFVPCPDSNVKSWRLISSFENPRQNFNSFRYAIHYHWCRVNQPTACALFIHPHCYKSFWVWAHFNPLCPNICKTTLVSLLPFSYQCITRSLEESNRCPKCNYIIDKPDQIFPNFLCKYFEKTTVNTVKLLLNCTVLSGHPVHRGQLWKSLVILPYHHYPVH